LRRGRRIRRTSERRLGWGRRRESNPLNANF
jgi:hypothetical protein